MTEKTQLFQFAGERPAEKTAAENGSQENSQNGSEAQSSVKETRVVKAAQSKLQCPGHVDLHITVYITGYDENNNLFAVDPIGGKEENLNENWAGWDKFRQLCAIRLEQQDWYEEYGLTVSTSMYVKIHFLHRRSSVICPCFHQTLRKREEKLWKKP